MTRLLIQQKPRLTIKQLENAGQVVFGVMILGQVASNNTLNFYSIGVGIIAITLLWSMSLLAARKEEVSAQWI